MATTYTPVLNLAKPQVNGAETENTWGHDINANFDKIDVALADINEGMSAEEVDDRVAQLLQAGTNIDLTYDDTSGALRIDANLSMGGGFVGGIANVSNSLAEARLTEFDATVKVLQLLGANVPGDAGPPMSCKRTNGPVTAHAGWFRSTDRYTFDGTTDATNGGYWEYRSRNQPIYIEWFGGKGDYYIVSEAPPYTAQQVNPTPTDNRQAFHDAVKFFYSWINYVHPTAGPVFSAGPTIQFGYQAYYCSDDLVPDRGVALHGIGSGLYHDGPQTQLVFPAGKRGLLCNAPSALYGGTGGGLARNIFFRCLGYADQTTKHGIEMHVGWTVEHCSVHNFGGNGIHIAADINAGTNANCFYLGHNIIYNNKGDGVFCLGGDANAGNGFALSVMSNGGWGINDSSFLGNYWYGAHASYNEAGDYHGVGGNNRSTWIANYSEGQAMPCIINNPSLWIGGFPAAGLGGDGYKNIGNVVIGTHSLNSTDTGDLIGVVNRRYANGIQRIEVPGGVFIFRWQDGLGIGYAMHDAAGFSWFWSETGNTYMAGRAEPIFGGAAVATQGMFVGEYHSGDSGRMIGTTDAAGYNFNGSFFQGSTLSMFTYAGAYATGDMLLDRNSTNANKGILVCTSGGGYGVDWISGRSYTPSEQNAHVHHIVTNSVGRTYRCVTQGPGNAANEPVHTSGEVTGADGYTWRFLSETRAVWKQALLMGQEGTKVNDPRTDIKQTWDNAAVQFWCNHTHVTDTASHADSELENWYVNGAKKAFLRKDGTFFSNGVPVVLMPELDELRETINALQARVTQLEALNG